MSTGSGTEVIVLPGGGYADHVPHEAEPVAEWLRSLGVNGAGDVANWTTLAASWITKQAGVTGRRARTAAA